MCLYRTSLLSREFAEIVIFSWFCQRFYRISRILAQNSGIAHRNHRISAKRRMCQKITRNWAFFDTELSKVYPWVLTTMKQTKWNKQNEDQASDGMWAWKKEGRIWYFSLDFQLNNPQIIISKHLVMCRFSPQNVHKVLLWHWSATRGHPGTLFKANIPLNPTQITRFKHIHHTAIF